MKTLLRLASAASGRPGPSWDVQADPVPVGERLVGLAVVAFLVLVLFA